MNRRRSNRRGYALMLVIVFVVLFTAVLGVAWRRVASALRIEHVCEVRKQCDAGSIQVLAHAMRVLETRMVWDAVNNVANLPVQALSEYPTRINIPRLPAPGTKSLLLRTRSAAIRRSGR